MALPDQLLLAWLGGANLATCLLFGLDKWQAARGGGRVPEAALLLASAAGGWPGGLLGIVVFRHKSAKPSFLLKFALVLPVWAGLITGAAKLAGTF